MWKIVLVLAVVAFGVEPLAISCKLVKNVSEAEDCRCVERDSKLGNGDNVNDIVQVCDNGNLILEVSDHVINFNTLKRTSTATCHYLTEVDQYSCFDNSTSLYYNRTSAEMTKILTGRYGEKLYKYLFPTKK